MNLLVRLLREGQTAAADLMNSERFDRPADRLGLFELLTNADLLSYSRLRDVDESASYEIREALRRSYLPVISESEWEAARGMTRNRAPVHSRRWVTFVPVARTDGLTLPDDGSPREELSTFTDIDNETAIITVPLTGPPTAEIIDNGHCTIPVRGRCSRGCGSCEVYEVMGERNGIVCICEHM